jgi:hypothetical protein
MFRSRAHPCYPEAAQPDGCFPDNAGRPSPFECWLAGARDRTSPQDRPQPASKRPSRRAPAGRLFGPDR